MSNPETSVATVIGTVADVMTLFGVSGFFTWSFVKKATQGKPLPDIGVAIFAYSIKVFFCVVATSVLLLLAYGLHFFIVLYGSGHYGGEDGLWNPQKMWSYVFAYFMTGALFIPLISLTVSSIFVWSLRPFKDLWAALKSTREILQNLAISLIGAAQSWHAHRHEASSLDLNLSTKKTRKQELLAQMDRVVPWAALVEVIAPYYPEGKNGRPPFALETMLRIHCMQQWFTLSDLAMEEAFFDTPIYREFAGLDAHGRMPDESTILRFRHRLEKHKLAEQILATVNELLAAQGLLLKAGTAVDATLIAAPSSTKNKDKKRDPEMHSSQKGNEWHFGMKAHIGVDADSGLVHTVIGTSGNVADVVEGNSLLHGQETDGFGDAGYQGIDKRPDAKKDVTWHIAMRPGKRRALDKENNPVDALIDQVEKIKASIRATRVRHFDRVFHPRQPSWVI